jgi:hypothetical protein
MSEPAGAIGIVRAKLDQWRRRSSPGRAARVLRERHAARAPAEPTQNERDYASLKAAIEAGRIEAQSAEGQRTRARTTARHAHVSLSGDMARKRIERS